MVTIDIADVPVAPTGERGAQHIMFFGCLILNQLAQPVCKQIIKNN